MTTILNLTQHYVTVEQAEANVIDLELDDARRVIEALNFNSLPTQAEIKNRCNVIYNAVCNIIDKDGDHFDGNELYDEKALKAMNYGFMIGGAPFLMGPLAEELSNIGTVLFAFSERVSVEKIIDGKTIKTSIFNHKGFVSALLA